MVVGWRRRTEDIGVGAAMSRAGPQWHQASNNNAIYTLHGCKHRPSKPLCVAATRPHGSKPHFEARSAIDGWVQVEGFRPGRCLHCWRCAGILQVGCQKIGMRHTCMGKARGGHVRSGK